MTPDNTDQIQDGRFKPGQSGNPAGRPPGSRNKTTLLAQGLLDSNAEALIKKLIQMALEGDTAAMRLAIERILPPRKDLPLEQEGGLSIIIDMGEETPTPQ